MVGLRQEYTVNLKQIAVRTAVTATLGLGALFVGSAVAVAQPVDEPGVNAAREQDDRERREEPQQPSACPWCDLVKAAQQLPPPGVPPLAVAEVAVPLSLGVGLPGIIPDFPIVLGALPTPTTPEVLAPNLPAANLMPAVELPPPPPLELPPPPAPPALPPPPPPPAPLAPPKLLPF